MTASTIVFDIETYRTTNEEIIERIRKEAYEKEPAKSATKAAKAEWFREDAQEERFREVLDKTAIDPMLAEVLCVVIALDDEMPVIFPRGEGAASEITMLSDVADYLKRNTSKESVWVGHNIEGFDLPILLNRWRALNIMPPPSFPIYSRGRWIGRTYDTMQRVPARTPFTSMDSICEALGIVNEGIIWKGEPMHGGRVAQAWEAGEHQLIYKYCADDVVVTRELYLALTFKGQWGTFERPNQLPARLEEIDLDASLTPAQKALTQVQLIKSAGAWPR